MPIQQDFVNYHKSIGQELKTSESRIRNLIGESHWLTDGEHKESILRKLISDFAPEKYRVGTGFVCYPGRDDETPNSGQLDILITSNENPTLYKSGNLQFVTPECASAIIEVKTKLTNGAQLENVLQKLSDLSGCPVCVPRRTGSPIRKFRSSRQSNIPWSFSKYLSLFVSNTHLKISR